MVTIA